MRCTVFEAEPSEIRVTESAAFTELQKQSKSLRSVFEVREVYNEQMVIDGEKRYLLDFSLHGVRQNINFGVLINDEWKITINSLGTLTIRNIKQLVNKQVIDYVDFKILPKQRVSVTLDAENLVFSNRLTRKIVSVDLPHEFQVVRLRGTFCFVGELQKAGDKLVFYKEAV